MFPLGSVAEGWLHVPIHSPVPAVRGMRAQLKRRHKYSLVLTCNLLLMVSRSRFLDLPQTHLQKWKKTLRIYIPVQIKGTTCRDNFKNGWATWGFESSNFSCLQDYQGIGSCWNDISKIFKALSNSKTLRSTITALIELCKKDVPMRSPPPVTGLSSHILQGLQGGERRNC